VQGDEPIQAASVFAGYTAACRSPALAAPE
jgi:hypothetical protein